MLTFWATFFLSKFITFSTKYAVSKHGLLQFILRFQKWLNEDVLGFQIGFVDLLALIF
jgi:hypothetical protein